MYASRHYLEACREGSTAPTLQLLMEDDGEEEEVVGEWGYDRTCVLGRY